MGKPQIIGYAEVWKGPPGFTLIPGGFDQARYLRTRPIYRERDFKATLSNYSEGCSLWCRKCDYRWSTYRLPHDSARLHATGYCAGLTGRRVFRDC